MVLVSVHIVVVVGLAVSAGASLPDGRPSTLARRPRHYVTVNTTCGEVVGVSRHGVHKFYGIPYASPPVGERRFAYAQPLNKSRCWNGTLRASKRGSRCIQILENGKITGDEDCLTLDIFTPFLEIETYRPQPVVVLIGAKTLAVGNSAAQPGADLANWYEVIFVRPNFRLGPFGFLALDILSNTKYPAASGNYALTDLLAALEWVHYNIKPFGGDPNSVTLLGHRAGATLTAALTNIKEAQPWFSRVWLSSPSALFEAEPLEKAQKENEQVKQLTKCQDVDCLRRIPPTEILAAIPKTWFSSKRKYCSLPTANENRHSWLVLDGDLLRMQIAEKWIEQKKKVETGNKQVFKPVIMVTTQHSAEARRMDHLNWTTELVEQFVNNSVINKTLGVEVYAQFNKSYEGLTELTAAVRTVCPLAQAARATGVPLYVVLDAGRDEDVHTLLTGLSMNMRKSEARFFGTLQRLFYSYVKDGVLPSFETSLVAVDESLQPLAELPACRFLAETGLVPNYAHLD